LYRVEMPRVPADLLAGQVGVVNVRHISAARASVLFLAGSNELDAWRVRVGIAHPINPLGLEELMVELGT
jgi:hypothetical protein